MKIHKGANKVENTGVKRQRLSLACPCPGSAIPHYEVARPEP